MIRRLAVLTLAAAAFLPGYELAAQEAERTSIGYQEGSPFSPAVQVGNTIYFSGKIGVSEETRNMEEGRIQAETRNIMESFRELFEEVGIGFEDVVKATVYVTDIADYGGLNEVYVEYFPTDAPARAALEVSDLVAGAIVEISFIAVKP
jgi:2-iminobutanoate/2-iminopropanoate deaminase